MAENFDIKKLVNAMQNKNLNGVKKLDGGIKDIKDVSLFSKNRDTVDEELLTKEGFVKNLYDGTGFTALDEGRNKVTKDQLEELYDVLESLSDTGKVSD